LYAAIDDFSPTALEERTDSIRVFFSSTSARDQAQSALASQFDAVAIDVSDEDWACRSQAGLQPVTVGRLTISPLTAGLEHLTASPQPLASPDVIVITPSMGFGTGHHATTRLCLVALQSLDLTDKSVLDVGTGSGVLAIAADHLGAARALGIDHDADAVQAARENLELNPAATHVTFAVGDLRLAALPRVDIVTANLTGALLVQTAALLVGAVAESGIVIASGFLCSERDEVSRTFAKEGAARIVWEGEEDGWVGLAVKKG
jgi:ribosomal protein L11 methyltransferase